ncbi:hypothetical protein ACOME3_001135 [Neoechinorhynchus agilis]
MSYHDFDWDATLNTLLNPPDNSIDQKGATNKSHVDSNRKMDKNGPLESVHAEQESQNQAAGLPGFAVDDVSRLEDNAKIDDIRRNIKLLCADTYGFGFIGSQPVSMTVKNMGKLKLLDYRVSWKADGTRYICFIKKMDEIYMIDRRNIIFQVKNLKFVANQRQTNDLYQTLLDGEMMIDLADKTQIPLYLIYDVIAFNGDPVGQNLDYDDRLALISREIVEPRRHAISIGSIDETREPFLVRKKNFYSLQMTRKLLDETFKKKLNNRSDGLIFQPNDMPYIYGTFHELMKWKPAEMNSVEFELVIPRKVLNKRQIGSEGFLHVRKYNKPFAGITLTAEMFNYDGKIIECVIEENQWKMTRVRNDRDVANTLQTAMAIKESIERPVTKKDLLKTISKIDPQLFCIKSIQDYKRVDDATWHIM